MRAVKTAVIKTAVIKAVVVSFLLFCVVAALFAWLVSSEKGSRWLLQQGLNMAPVTIEVDGISGTLAEGLDVESISIMLPDVEIKVSQVLFSWHAVSLLAGSVELNEVRIAELDIEVLDNDSAPDDSNADQLFWLQIPLQIQIESGRIDKLRIEDVAFENISLVGSIGYGQLNVKTLAAETTGVKLQLSGELSGPDPGRLEAIVDWEMLTQNQSGSDASDPESNDPDSSNPGTNEPGSHGSGSFSGDINKLAFTHVLNVPETVNFNGAIFNLFDSPTLDGIADWVSIHLPGESALFSNAGKFIINSNFSSAHIVGDNVVLLESWPQAPLQLQAFVDLKGITIESYTIDALDGQVTGHGRFEFDDVLHGKLQINATQINTGILQEEFPGRIDVIANLQMQSMDRFALDVTSAKALINDTQLSGTGSVQWQGEKLLALNSDINAGSNRLTADVKLDTNLAGSINLKAPELDVLWPGLQGKMDASIILSGTPARPQASVQAAAEAVSFNALSLDTFTFSGELQEQNRITGKLAATGLLAEKQQVGNLGILLDGTLANHQTTVNLAGGEVDAKFGSSGGWDNAYYTQRFEYGYVQISGLEGWHLEQNPELRLSADAGNVSAHCWKQHTASICVDDSKWGSDTLQSNIEIKDFALQSLQPLLADGYSIDGTVDADIKFKRNSEGLQQELKWRQSRTLISFSDDAETAETLIEAVRIDLLSNQKKTDFTFKLTGEQGLNLIASATVNGPIAAESPLKATAKGVLPSIELLRPLARRVLHPGQLQGELLIDLDVSGTLEHPSFVGGATLSDGTLELLGAGITYRDINIVASSRGNDKLQLTGDLRSGDGSANIQGEVQVIEKQGLVADLTIKGQNLATVRAVDLSVDVSPDIKLHIGKDVFDISGSIMIPHAIAKIRDLPKNTVPRSEDVVVHTPERGVEKQQGSIVTGDVEVLLGDDIRFSGFGLTSRLEGGFRLTQTRGGYLHSGGTIRVLDGFFTGYGKELRVDRGELTFTGPLDDPLINIQVSRESIYESRQYTIGLRLTGSAQNVKTETFSRPSMSEQDVLSFLLIDRPSSSESDASGAAIALGLQQLVPGDKGALGLDEVSFETNDANQATMVAGKRLSDKIYVRYVFGASGQPGEFKIRYSLGKGFSLESSSGYRQSLDLIYLLER